MEGLGQFLPLILIFGIMYLLLIRPQQQKLKAHKAMVAALRKGDQVITQGGMIAKVTKVIDDDKVEIEISKGIKVQLMRDSVAAVTNKTEPAS